MMAWWTDTSTTGNIIRDRPRRRRLRWLSRLRLRRQCGVANAADPGPSELGFDGTKIGELVIVLRSECTGRWPVHFFGRIAGVAAALAVAAMPTIALAEAPSAAAVQRPAVGGQGIADFYRGRSDYPF